MLIRGGLGLGIIFFAVWVYCLLEVIMTDESRIRNLSKTTWIMIVLLTFEVGAVAWLVAGRPTTQPRDLPYKGNTGRPVPRYPEYDRPGRFAATNPDDDEAFLRQVRERAEQQTRAAREQRAERERQQSSSARSPKTAHPIAGRLTATPRTTRPAARRLGPDHESKPLPFGRDYQSVSMQLSPVEGSTCKVAWAMSCRSRSSVWPSPRIRCTSAPGSATR